MSNKTSPSFTRALAATLALGVLLLPGCTNTDDVDVRSTLEAFYGAMKSGDTAVAMAQIAPDAEFVESGRLETREQYEQNHLPNDIAFEKQVTGTRSPFKVTINGDTAWAIAVTEFDGTFDGEPVSFTSAQLAVLSRESDGWKIRSIHWSSRPR